MVEIVTPSLAYLSSYVDALRRGWSPDNVRLNVARLEQLAAIEADAAAFVASLDDPEGRGPPIELPDGTTVKRLPSIRRWIWDGEAAGSIGLRWQPGTSELPPHILGHIGYAVPPWKRRRGYATAALGLILDEARQRGLEWVWITADPGNLPSQKVILANGGMLEGKRAKHVAYGGESMLYRIRF